MVNQSQYAAALRRIFTTESVDTHLEEPAHTPSDRPLIFNIGRGTCGSVYGIGATNRAIKFGSDQRELSRDFQQTGKAWQTVQQLQQMLSEYFIEKGMRISVPQVPRCYDFHSDCKDVITRYEEELSGDEGSIDTDISEKERQKPGYTMERIPPISTAARVALIREIFDEDDQDEFLSNPENEDCLIRLYFGKEESGGFLDTLRNFPLHDDQMDEIGLDTKTLVVELAVGLAMIHWGMELDGMDVEFVLSSSRSELAGIQDARRRDTHLWILDFDKAAPVSIDHDRDDLIRRLVVATSGNDPYFPRPSVNEERWDQFRWAYVEAGKRILQEKIEDQGTERDLLALPEAFVQALEVQFEEEDASEEETFIRFEEEDPSDDEMFARYDVRFEEEDANDDEAFVRSEEDTSDDEASV